MSKYYVEMPVVMKLMFEVEAKNEEEARDKAFEKEIYIKIEEGDEGKTDTIDYEWDMYDKIVEGNVYHGIINKIDIMKVE